MPVGEAFLSAFLQVAFDRLFSTEFINFLRGQQLTHVLEKLKLALSIAAGMIYDAEWKQHNDQAVETWLIMLKDAVYEAEDLLDEIGNEALEHKLRQEYSSNTTVSRGTGKEVEVELRSESPSGTKMWDSINKSLSKIPQTFINQIVDGATSAGYQINSNFNPFKETTLKLHQVIDRLDYLASQKKALGLRVGSSASASGTRLESTSLISEPGIYGRDSNKDELIKLLLSETVTRSGGICVIPIVGMGGIGKTALAQVVYNDNSVTSQFELMVWVCVSDDFNVKKITKTILASVTSRNCGIDDLNLLQLLLEREMRGKKFLLVLDDVWNENPDQWNALQKPLRTGARGSKVLVTTRSKIVSSLMGTVPDHYLEQLSDEDCWMLFKEQAFQYTDFETSPFLVILGKQIAKKCKGLPLAAKALGGFLKSKQEKDEWAEVLKNEIWDLPNEIIPALRLSYHYLPMYLKQCFAYCALFPKGYEFDKEILIRLWMAEGFLQQPRGQKTLEDVSEEYFRDLLSRSFFQQVSGKESHFVMHDLVNDLAQYVSKDFCFQARDDKPQHIFDKCRHLSYISGFFDDQTKFQAYHHLKLLRTFLPLNLAPPSGPCFLTCKVPRELLPACKFIRVLSLSHYNITILPETIGTLKHLRYMDLSYTSIYQLPESINTLYNLQTLTLLGCHHLEELPTSMGKLINLRHFDLTGVKATKMPLHMSRLKNLKTLPTFIVGSTGSSIFELKNNHVIQGTLSFQMLENVDGATDALQANLKTKQYLEELNFNWSTDPLCGGSNNVKDVLEMLQPHRNLKRMSINSYGGVRFPRWIGDPSFSKMISIHLKDCKNCVLLPSLGQLPFLKNLLVSGLDSIKKVGLEFYGNFCSSTPTFQTLETLRFEEMPAWEKWFSLEDGGFPCLKELYVRKCPELTGDLPYHLPCLNDLVIYECQKLRSSIPKVPRICNVELNKCDGVMMNTVEGIMTGVVSLRSLSSLFIRKIPNLACLPKGFLQYLPAIVELRIISCPELTTLSNRIGLQHLTCIQRLEISKCPELEELPGELHRVTSLQSLAIKECPSLLHLPETGLPPNITNLTIEDCEALESLPKNLLTSNTCLEMMEVIQCPALTSLPEGDLPSTLIRLEIVNCTNIRSLPEGIMLNNSRKNRYGGSSSSPRQTALEKLYISGCNSISDFPRGDLPDTLKILRIWDCQKLKFLPERIMHYSRPLELLHIRCCSSLKTLPLSLLEAKSLVISYCENLECLPEGLHTLTSPSDLQIHGCSKLEYFPLGGLPTSLTSLQISDCAHLKSLPDAMYHLTSLQELHLQNSPLIESIPEGGLPLNLTSLVIDKCNKLVPKNFWGLHGLSSLEYFEINGCVDLESFPEEWSLPSSLTSLKISNLPNIRSLERNGLHHLSSLKELNIWHCPNLQVIPAEWLPTSLSFLYIFDCPLLEKQCKRVNGKDWHKISHIPSIIINGEVII